MQPTLTIYRDGTIDPSHARKEKLRTARRATLTAVKRMLTPLVEGLSRACDEWDLYEYDQKHGTHFLADYRAKRATERDRAMALQFGL